MKLTDPFSRDEIKWRVQRSGFSNGKPWAIVIPYLDSRAIQERLDNALGSINWENRFDPYEKGVICRLTLRLIINDDAWAGGWVTKADGSEYTDIEGFKGACSKALVRAASQFGIGRELYKTPTIYAKFVDKSTKAHYAKIKDKDGKEHHLYWIPDLPEKRS